MSCGPWDDHKRHRRKTKLCRFMSGFDLEIKFKSACSMKEREKHISRQNLNRDTCFLTSTLSGGCVSRVFAEPRSDSFQFDNARAIILAVREARIDGLMGWWDPEPWPQAG